MIFRWLWIPAVVVAVDQLTKLLALQHLRSGDIALAPFLNLALAFNTGAAFSFLANAGATVETIAEITTANFRDLCLPAESAASKLEPTSWA